MAETNEKQEEKDYGRYLDDRVKEVLADKDWALPKEMREMFLGKGLEWSMLFI